MWRLLLALLMMSAVCCESGLFRDDLRTPEAVATINGLRKGVQARQQQQEPQHIQSIPLPTVPTLPPLQSPGLVNGLATKSGPVVDQFSGSSVKQPLPAAYSSTYVDLPISDQIAKSVFNFANYLGQHLGYKKTEIFSPLSIVNSLALLLLGARGRSYEELSAVFGISDTSRLHEQFGLMLQDLLQPTREGISQGRPLTNWRANSPMRSNRRAQRPGAHEVHLANGLFTQTGYSLNPDYRRVIAMVYGSDLEVQDFEGSPATARYNINSWVARNTKNRIENIISSDIPQSTRMILANALYFKAFWETDFIESATRPDNFYPYGEGTEPVVRVQMMATGGSYPYHEDHELGCKIIGLPYRGNLSTMYIIQPFKSSVGELMTLQMRLTAEKVEDLISRMYRRQALVAFPKMHLTESMNLKTVMQKMSLGGIFSTVQNDLSLIATNEVSRTSSLGGNSLQNLEAQRRAGAGGAHSDLVVDDIVHKVDFTVNEQGTEAAASTVTYLKKSGPDVLFRGDTPFMVLVRHDPTKLVLFYGLINEPPAAV
ncbi:serine protease inhibitor 28Dc [Drosophila subpulchrella]|uniref:serine protease inhibitor 28Dc n=1 Tax=Drosophila subpulchrella TaxID=1486046 RepID=UPI0018A1A751|nr:serine protease inhibitor 28Dc [Drosophila subpulchrella]